VTVVGACRELVELVGFGAGFGCSFHNFEDSLRSFKISTNSSTWRMDGFVRCK
jgi:hypothetical protein